MSCRTGEFRDVLDSRILSKRADSRFGGGEAWGLRDKFEKGLEGRFEVWRADLRSWGQIWGLELRSWFELLRVKLRSEWPNLRAQRAEIRPETADLRLRWPRGRQRDGRTSKNSRVLQDIGPLGPLPKKHINAIDEMFGCPQDSKKVSQVYHWCFLNDLMDMQPDCYLADILLF